MLKLKRNLIAIIAGLGLTPLALADAGVSAEVGYLFNTLLLLICGVLVMFMAAGFTMLEAGMVRSKSVAVILAKNIALYSIASINVLPDRLSVDVRRQPGRVHSVNWRSGRQPRAGAADVSAGQPSMASWFFQMVFVATAASVVSVRSRRARQVLAVRDVRHGPADGCPLPRRRALDLGRWLARPNWASPTSRVRRSFTRSADGPRSPASSCSAHAVGRFDADGKPVVLAPSSLPIVTLGTFILWLGWFGFNGGSQLAFSSTADALAVATIFGNTNAAAAGGVIATIVVIAARSTGVSTCR